ncbi:peroxiredoxin [Aquabacterium sp. OR-4]|uniref:peroxiredoxin n=1 Tax=Aquabacterium sp. OR-4 TaxID=2978127 RepID=UPI0021B47C9B|nr:peroxiredoxin [Aquabacterium sp. OR-4]MDT7834889.1 peroxiredoxin [Aquabacterium sp. OR-4]
MPRTLATAAAFALVLGLAGPAAQAALDVGDKAPDFTLDAALGGNVFRFSLADALKQGPVVLYFFPAAFSVGCTIEAHQFAEATDQFKQLGATVIGVSADDLESLKRFSVTECRNKFAVGADVDQKVMKAYDAVLKLKPDFANRTSYLISPDSKVQFQFTSLNPHRHVTNTMNALKAWQAARKSN